MTTLLSELVRILSAATARALRERANDARLSRSEAMAIATLSEMAATCLAGPPPPVVPDGAPDWPALEALAAFDMHLIEDIRRTT